MRLLLKIVGVFLAGLLALAGLLLAVFWVPDVPVDALKARWAGGASRFVAVDGLDMHVRDEGPRDDAVPVVLLHGTSASLHTWDGWTKALVGRRRVVRFDLPGFGLTGPSPGEDYSMEAYARRVLALLDKLEVRRFAIGGNSFGGAVAIAVALAAPDRVDKLVLVDSAGYSLGSTSVPLGFRIAALPGARYVMGSVLPRFVIESSLRNVYGHPERVTTELVDLYFDMARRAGNRRALLGRRKQAPPDALAARIPSLRVPTLILWGGQDRLIPPANAERFKAAIPGAKVVVFDDLGHVPMEEDPERTVAPVRAFLGLE